MGIKDKKLKDFTPEERQEFIDELKARLTDDQYEILSAIVQAITAPETRETANRYADTARTIISSLREFLPALQEELEKDPDVKKQAEAMTADAFFSSDLFDRLAEKAIQKLENAGTDLKPALPQISGQIAEKVEFPLDKVNSYIWRLLETDTNGQIAFDVAPANSKKAAAIIYSIDFSEISKELSITKKLEPYDKLVYLAVSALYNEGKDVITLQQIYNTMGCTGRAGKTDREKINASLTKMVKASIFINNATEATALKNRTRFTYDGSLLPMERIQAYVNGQLTESAIHIFREPPMVSFAKERKQITTIDRQLLESPLSKTNANILLEDYLIERISHIKKGKTSNKMLYKTIFENAAVKTEGKDARKYAERAKKKIRDLLNSYQAKKFIKGYTEEKDGISILF